jgi:hypothetical protein
MYHINRIPPRDLEKKAQYMREDGFELYGEFKQVDGDKVLCAWWTPGKDSIVFTLNEHEIGVLRQLGRKVWLPEVD